MGQHHHNMSPSLVDDVGASSGEEAASGGAFPDLASEERALCDAEAAVGAAKEALVAKEAETCEAEDGGGVAVEAVMGEAMRCANRAGATMRAGAGMESEVVGELALGAVVTVTRLVELPDGRVRARCGDRGWVSAKLLVALRPGEDAARAKAAWERVLRLLGTGPPPAADPAVRAALAKTFAIARPAASASFATAPAGTTASPAAPQASAKYDDATVQGLESLCLGVAARVRRPRDETSPSSPRTRGRLRRDLSTTSRYVRMNSLSLHSHWATMRSTQVAADPTDAAIYARRARALQRLADAGAGTG